MEYFSFGERMSIYRRRAKLSKTALAEKTGISVRTLSGYEADRILPDIEAVNKISLVLGVSVNRMLAGFDDPNCRNYLKGLLAEEDIEEEIEEEIKKYIKE